MKKIVLESALATSVLLTGCADSFARDLVVDESPSLADVCNRDPRNIIDAGRDNNAPYVTYINDRRELVQIVHTRTDEIITSTLAVDVPCFGDVDN